MKYFGQIVDKAKTALESENWDELKELMNANFEQRRKLYTGKNDSTYFFDIKFS